MNIPSDCHPNKDAFPPNFAAIQGQDNGGPVNFIRFKFGERELSCRGRDAWALGELLKAGAGGVTPITHPGPRWSGYVLKLRKLGLVIETVHETHGGPYSGRHARYVLRSQIEVTEVRAAGAEAVAA